jgi:hypothetical protein
VTVRPEDVPGLSDLAPAPDAATRTRLVAGVAALVGSERPSSNVTPRRRWTRPAVVLVVVTVMVAIVLVPLLGSVPARPSRSSTSTNAPTTSTTGSSQTANTPFRSGSAVPIADLVAVSFWSDSGGAALARLPGASGPAQLATTHDGGRDWTAGSLLPAPGGIATSSLVFTSASTGFSWGQDIVLATTDGGRTWVWKAIPGASMIGSTLTSVSAAGASVWAAFECDGACASADRRSAFASVWSWTPGGSWGEVLAPALLDGGYVQEVVRHAGTDLVLVEAPTAYQMKFGAATGELLVSTDLGATWSTRSLPCGSIVGHDGTATPQQPFEVTPVPASVAVVTGVPGEAALLACTGQDMMQLEPESIWALSALGTQGRWQLQADDLAVAGLANPHVPPDVGAAHWSRGAMILQTPTAGVIWMSGGQAGASRSTDGGRVWQWTTIPGFFPQVQFLDDSHGWCLLSGHPQGDLFATSDGGTTWSPLR